MAYTDRATTLVQSGAKQISFPLQSQGEYYARNTRRPFMALASEYAPIMGTLTSWTNSITYSEVLTNGAWTATNTTVTDNQTTNPADGQTTMSKFLETVTNGEHRIAQAVTFTAVPWTVSCFVKGGLGRTNFYVRANDGTNSFSGYFDISAGTVGTLAANTTGTILALNNGTDYYRLSITFTPAAAAGNVYFNVASSGSVISYTGDTAKGMYVWGCQANAGSSAGPYIATTSVARTVSSPPLDSTQAGVVQDPFAYLCEETEPDAGSLARGWARWDRLYCRIPKQLVTYTTMAITKPSAPQTSVAPIDIVEEVASSYSFTSIGHGTIYDGYGYTPNNKIYGQVKDASASSQANVTSGQFRVKYKASTTANLNYNDSDATVAAAINGLASVIAEGITVTVQNYFNGGTQLNVIKSAGTFSAPFIVDANSFNASASYLFVSYTDATLSRMEVAYLKTITSHGFSSSDVLFSGTATILTDPSPTAYLFQPQDATLTYGSWALVDSSTIAVSPTFNGYDKFGKYLRDYTPGPDRVKVKLIQDFYLPGVTTGITTAADITVPDPLINDAAFLDSVVSNLSGYVSYDSDPLQFWKGPIYTQVKQQIDMGDV
jgi:hypothetical protein